MYDLRYKVTQEDVNTMRIQRADGASYAVIGKYFKVSWATAYYWCNEKSREKQKIKNAKRRHNKSEKARNIVMNNERRRRLTKDNLQWKTQQIIQCAKDEPKNRNSIMNSHTGKRMKMIDALKLYDSKEYCLENSKIK